MVRSPRAPSTRIISCASTSKWGEKKWLPREEIPRDNGCCYHAVGPHGAEVFYPNVAIRSLREIFRK
jgi:hypothetical protein